MNFKISYDESFSKEALNKFKEFLLDNISFESEENIGKKLEEYFRNRDFYALKLDSLIIIARRKKKSKIEILQDRIKELEEINQSLYEELITLKSAYYFK